MNTEVICTLGPASMAPTIIQRLVDQGVSLLRLNLSHTPIDKLRSQIEHVRRATEAALCLDTEGAQIRTGDLVGGTIELKCGARSRIGDGLEPGDDQCFGLYPRGVWRKLEVGDLVSLDFNAALVQVVARDRTGLDLQVLCGGKVGRNKAVSVDREIELPGLTDKDLAAIEIGRSMGIANYALSFAANAGEVVKMRELVGPGCRIVAKIESTHGLRNQRAIASEADAILIDRGDLSRQIPIEAIPAAQKQIIGSARELQTPAFVATNLLETMIDSPNPTRAEVNDIYNTLVDGASGLVLAAETAIGVDPVKSVRMLCRVIRQFERGGPVGSAPPAEVGPQPANIQAYELRATQARAVFESKGWGRVAAVLGPAIDSTPSLSLLYETLSEVRADGLVLDRSLAPSDTQNHELAERILWTSWPTALTEGSPAQWDEAQWLAFVDHLVAMGCTHCYVVHERDEAPLALPEQAELDRRWAQSNARGIELVQRSLPLAS